MLYLDQKYAQLVSTYLKRFKRVRENLWNFRCPLCGDSKKNAIKSRGYFFSDGKSIIFKCQNCGVSHSLYNFIKQISPSLASEYKMEWMREMGFQRNKVNKHKIDSDLSEKLKKVTNNLTTTYKTVLPASLVSQLPNDHECVKYLESRKIPKKYYKFLQYTDDFGALVTPYSATNGKYPHDKRLVIPVYNQNGELTHIQGRALDKDAYIRYATVTVKKDAEKIFGLDRIKHNQKKYVLEGPIDSLFVPNSIAVMDSCLHKRGTIPKEFIMIHDCQPRNKEIVKQLKSSIDNGYKVVIFPENINGKDINEMILNGYTQDEIMKIIEDNTYQGLTAKLKFDKWRKV